MGEIIARRHYRPKQVELIEIINKPLLLHLVGYLYYWQMGFNSVFKGLTRSLIHAKKNLKCGSIEMNQQISLKTTDTFSVDTISQGIYETAGIL